MQKNGLCIPKNYAVIVLCIYTVRGSHANNILAFILLICGEEREPILAVLGFWLENTKFIFHVSPVT